MSLFQLTKDSILPVAETTFADQGIKERSDLQRLFRENVNSIAPDTYVLAEEFGEWEGAKRRIDLLCLDRDANIVVVELKRSEDGGHMELQAIRYAAMVSTMTFERAVETHARYLKAIGRNEDAEVAILHFLNWDEPRENEFARDTQIILVSGEFSKEITTSVMWLNDRNLNIRCVRLRPYVVDSRVLLDIQQVIPLPEAAEYQVQLSKKAAEERQSRNSISATMYEERNRDILKFFKELMPNQTSRQAPAQSWMQIPAGYGSSAHYEFQFRGRGDQKNLRVAIHFESEDGERNQELCTLLKENTSRIRQVLCEEPLFEPHGRATWTAVYVERRCEPWSQEIAHWAAQKMRDLIKVVQPLLDKHLGQQA